MSGALSIAGFGIELHDADRCLEEETLRLLSKAGRK